MKKYMCLLGASLVLGGCVSNAPKLTPEELKEKRISTLNIYDDNRVAVRVDRSGRRGGNDIIFINESNDEAVVYSTGKEYFNALDLVSITQDKDDKIATFLLKTGDKKTFSKASLAVLWCNKEKVCRNTRSGQMKTIYEWTLNRVPQRNPSYDIETNGTAPMLIENGIKIVSGSGYDSYAKKINDYYAQWPEAEKKIIAKRDAENQAVADAKSQAVKTGKVNCTSTSYSCGRSYSDATSLQCTGFRSNVGNMSKDGWIVANVNAEPVRANLGEMCDHNVYHFYYKR